MTITQSLARKQKTAWKQAVEDEDLSTLQSLHSQGFDLEWSMGADVAHGKLTALQLACFNDWKEGALWLVDAGAQVGKLARSGSSALSFAVLGGDVEVIEALLKKDSGNINHVSVFGNAPLHDAVSGDGEVVSLLLQYGADPTLKNDRGLDALDLARKNNGPDMQELVENAWRTQQVLLENATVEPIKRNAPRRV